jgi:ketosteroid isomerase-like protein
MTDKSCIVAAITFLTVLSPWACAGETSNKIDNRAAIGAFTRELLRVFENLDMKQFIACFADDATVFFPMPEPPERVQGKQAIQQRFERPEDLSIQLIPGHTAVVSFHLRNEERIGRRTLVLTKMNGQWLIIHLHASNAPVAAKSKNH